MLTGRPRYAVWAALASLLAVALVVAGWLLSPRDSGVDAQWETAALREDVLAGTVLGGRALVARSGNVAVDLVTGKQITLGSVSGRRKAVAGQRFLILTPTQLDAATLDASQRWSYPAPSGTTLSYVAGNDRITVLRQCRQQAGTPCDLVGVGTGGRPSWTASEPSDAVGHNAVLGASGALPAFGVLPGGSGSVWLIDPDSGRFVLRPATKVSVAADGTVRLSTGATDGGSGCATVEGKGVDALRPIGFAPPCPGSKEPAQATTTSTHGGRVLWWPFVERDMVKVSGRHTAQVVGARPTRVLLADDGGLTVRVGDVVRRYAYAP